MTGSTYSPCRVIVEFMDGTERTYEPVGGFVSSPRMSGDGQLPPVVMDLIYKGGQGAPVKHLATIPLANVRQYRVEEVR